MAAFSFFNSLDKGKHALNTLESPKKTPFPSSSLTKRLWEHVYEPYDWMNRLSSVHLR
jgi:hypothetical protein